MMKKLITILYILLMFVLAVNAFGSEADKVNQVISSLKTPEKVTKYLKGVFRYVRIIDPIRGD